MTHVREMGLAVGFVALVAAIVAAALTEGLGLVVVVVVAALVVGAVTIPFAAMYEEEHRR